MTSRLAAIAIPVATGLAACSGPAPRNPAIDGYLHDRAYRREQLELSLVAPHNGYSQRRLRHYATGRSGDWDALPVWNPPVAPVRAADLGPGASATQPLPAGARALEIPEAAKQGSVSALRALGKLAFTRYPVQTLGPAAFALASPDSADRYGLWSDAKAGVGGLVWTRMADGAARLSMTCSTCHARETPHGLTPGLPNTAFDPGRLLADAAGDGPDPVIQAELAWGPGRLDPASRSGLEPVRIPDLRPVRDEAYLQADGTVEQRSVTSLAIRIETLVITSQNAVVRPPREVALGLAIYVRSLADSLPRPGKLDAVAQRGRDLFQQSCARCHAPPTYSGLPVPLAVVGTDPVAGRSPERGTGAYRVPSLRGVSTRGPLLHDASLPGVATLFDPARLDPHYSGGRLGPGAVKGHYYGLDLAPPDRAALIAFLQTL